MISAVINSIIHQGEWEVLLFVTKVLVFDLYFIEKVIYVLDIFQVLWVLELVLLNMKSTTCNRLKYLEKYLTPTLAPYHLRRYGNIT